MSCLFLRCLRRCSAWATTSVRPFLQGISIEAGTLQQLKGIIRITEDVEYGVSLRVIDGAPPFLIYLLCVCARFEQKFRLLLRGLFLSLIHI